jgi:hypothetical protein
MTTPSDPARTAAVARLRKQSAWKRLAILFVIIWIVLTFVWYLTGGGSFWPAWAILGMAIALVLIGIDAFGPVRRGPTEGQIQREMKKMDGTS